MKGLHDRALFAAMLAVALLAVSCTGGEGESPSDKDTLIIGVGALPVTLDHETVPSVEGGSEIILNVYDPLIRFETVGAEGYERADYGKGLDSYKPWLAEDISLSDDGLTWTIRLRTGVRSHYGNELTTDDIVWLVERHQALNAQGAFGDFITGLAGPESINVMDKYTFSFTTEQPNPLAADGLGLIFSLPPDSTEIKKHATADDPWASEWLEKNEAGFGPYELVSFEPGNQLVLESFADYWGPQPAIKRVIYKEVPEAATRLQLLQGGQLDVAEYLSVRDNAEAAKSPGLKAISVPGTFQAMGQTNVAKGGPFAVREVRQALQLLTPQEDIVNRVYAGGGGARVWPGVVPDIYAGYTGEWPWDYDSERGKELLAQAGFADGFDVEILIDNARPSLEETAIILQDSWAQAGVNVEIAKVPTSAYQARKADGNFDIVLDINSAFLVDTQYFLFLWYSTDFFINFGKYSNPKVDRAIQLASETLDQEDRLGYFQEAIDELMQDMPWVYLNLVNTEWAMVDNLEGLVYYPSNALILDELHFS